MAEQYELNPKTVAKWRARKTVQDAPMGPKDVRLTHAKPRGRSHLRYLSQVSLLLDDCLYALPHPAVDALIAAPLFLAARHQPFARYRMNRTIKEGIVKRYHYGSHDELRQQWQTFLMAYNFVKRLQTLKRLTPYEYICKIWTMDPEAFSINRSTT